MAADRVLRPRRADWPLDAECSTQAMKSTCTWEARAARVVVRTRVRAIRAPVVSMVAVAAARAALEAAAQQTQPRLAVEMARSTARGVNHLALWGQQVFSEAGLEDRLSQLEPQIRPALRESTQLLLYFKFGTLKDEEIRQYLEFVRSPDGQWLQDIHELPCGEDYALQWRREKY